MKNIYLPYLLIAALLFFNCSKDNPKDGEEETEDPTHLEAYFPPADSDTWETLSLDDLDWNSDAEQPLYDFLEERNTDAFLVLKDGRIVLEYYFGDFEQTDNHAWNSAGKTLTSMTVGIAQEEGYLALEDSSVDYLGSGWSSMTDEQEQNVSVWNHLTMTTGLDYTVDDNFCYDSECLIYKNEPGDYWFYHNAPYTLLDQIVTGAVETDFEDYFYEKIRDKIGMQGLFISVGYNNIFFSTARSMARFGILNLNEGTWDEQVVLGDSSYIQAMTTTSQNLNLAYGYLFWLNGKSSYRLPGSETEFTGKLIPNAPDDLYAGLGANDQKLYIVPSEKLVVVRLGGDAGESSLGPTSFDNELWGLLNAVMD